jgi:hypothetical protein
MADVTGEIWLATVGLLMMITGKFLGRTML